ncbi:TerB family tellurite resistance protein [Phyllobacterium leguminum]|uniref:Putative tellurite resistance protein B-like protein n=1 Tax=Phyllobacterium leguminum TaxID=314237 RepID=A0A318T3Z9_9HYPH|nr:TerB family tellurite resistance protein [Phyllobacterium leguminum]PYE88919.1 putative tellurite resistance protein B-like protein [Phyllobacterium leguminum]
MLDRLQTFLKELSSGEGRGGKTFGKDDPRLAVAALMFHIIDADGERHEEERRRIAEMLSEAYQLKDGELNALLQAAEAADQEAIDLYSFTSVIKRHLDERERIHLIELMWEIAYADGEVGEMEDNVIWRVAELIGVSTRDRVTLKHVVAERVGADKAKA